MTYNNNIWGGNHIFFLRNVGMHTNDFKTVCLTVTSESEFCCALYMILAFDYFFRNHTCEYMPFGNCISKF